ncbi:MAG: response regulator [Deltaproteobacteria bacterium]|nr:response regulator [Deltaproteobacteria bacterium]
MTDPAVDPRAVFLRSLPRKVIEIKAAHGAVVADPRPHRMRDELRRRIHALYTLARAYGLPTLAEGLRASIEVLDQARTLPSLAWADLDKLSALLGSFLARAEQDVGHPLTGTSVPPPIPPPIPPPVHETRKPQAPREDLRIQTLVGLTVPKMDPPSSIPPAHTGVPSQLPGRVAGLQGGTVSVLFVGAHVNAATLRAVLPPELELVPAATCDEGLARAREIAPDVVLAEVGGPADGARLLTAVRADTLTDFLPVVLIASPEERLEALRERCPEAAEVLAATTDAAQWRSALERVLASSASTLPNDLGDLTLEELTRALQDELRRGLTGSVSPRQRAQRVAFGHGSDVLAATWEAIARIREVVERRAHGAVRFEHPSAPRGLPGTQVFALSDEVLAEGGGYPGEDPLPGRRILVVDDDPAVVATFSSLLRDTGAQVLERTDGEAALRTARAERPDLVLADILMPGLDGFALCRALRREVALRHTPVILLSWREDLLHRMRELGAQAQGYLRKEARGEAILARVRGVLRGRQRVLRRIAELGPGVEVRGRLERIGTYLLLEEASRLGDAVLTLADSAAMTSLELRGGRLVSALRTVQDGTLVRGEPALRQALGAPTGRFLLRRATHPVRSDLEGDLAALLHTSARVLTALEEAVSGSSLLEIGPIELDRDAALAYARSLPAPMRALIDRLVRGEAPRELVLRDGVAPGELEPLLVELARRGSILRVLNRRGEDLSTTETPRPEALTQEPAPAQVPVVAHAPAATVPETPTIALPPTPMATPEVAHNSLLEPTVLHRTVESPAVSVAVSGGARGVPSVSTVGPREGGLRAPTMPFLGPPEEPSAGAGPIAPDSLAAAVWRELRDTVSEPRWQSLVPPSPAPVASAPVTAAPPAVPPSLLPELDTLSDGSRTALVERPTLNPAEPVAAVEVKALPRAPEPAPEAPPATETDPMADVDAAFRALESLPEEPVVEAPPGTEPVPLAARAREAPTLVPEGDREVLLLALARTTPGPGVESPTIATIPPERPRRGTLETAAEAPSRPEEPTPPTSAGLPGAVPFDRDGGDARDGARTLRWHSRGPEPVKDAPASVGQTWKPGPPVAPSRPMAAPESVARESVALEERPTPVGEPDPEGLPGAPGPEPAEDLRPEAPPSVVLAEVAPTEAPAEPPSGPEVRAEPPPAVGAAPEALVVNDPPAVVAAQPPELPPTSAEPMTEPPPVGATTLEALSDRAVLEALAAEPDAPAPVPLARRMRTLTPPPPPRLLPPPERTGIWSLALLVAVAFAGSYYGVSWFVNRVEEDAPTPPEAPPTPPRTTPDASSVVAASTDIGAATDAPAATDGAPPTTPPAPEPGGPYESAAPWLDGGTLAPDQGLLVVRRPRAGASAVELQVDQRVVGQAPLALALSQGLHTIRFRAGIVTSYQFATVRPGLAVVLTPPSDR